MSDKLIKKPTTGMKDILPEEMEIRDYVESLVRETYGSFGFTHIETPVVEHIENLTSNQGGENEKLIFKIMKRGEKLDIAHAEGENDLADSGLRYDLTLPLSRYYANNNPSLQMPFKALQMGNVFRADRPQKGRFRQFKQCDIDIIGDPSDLAEIELVGIDVDGDALLLVEHATDAVVNHAVALAIHVPRALKLVCRAGAAPQKVIPEHAHGWSPLVL